MGGGDERTRQREPGLQQRGEGARDLEHLRAAAEMDPGLASGVGVARYYVHHHESAGLEAAAQGG